MDSKDAMSAAIRIETDELKKLQEVEAPPCPKCGRPIEVVDVVRYPGRWEWSGEKGAYVVVTLNPAEEYVCSHCGEVVGGHYGNGSKWGFEPLLT